MKLSQDTPSDRSPTHLEQEERLVGEITILGVQKQHLSDQTDMLHEINDKLEAKNEMLRTKNEELLASISALHTEEEELKDGITSLFGTWCSMANLNKMVAGQGMLRWNSAHTRHQAQKIEIQRRHIDEVQRQLTELRSREAEHHQMESLEALIGKERLQAEIEEAKKQVYEQHLYAH